MDFMRLKLSSLIYLLPVCLAAQAIAQVNDKPSDAPLNEVKFFQALPPPPGQAYGRLTAAVGGVLNIKDGCLRIGKSIPTLDYDLIFSEDEDGLYLKHVHETHKYRMGDKITGGGGYGTAAPGETREGCTPEPENGHAYFVSFYLESGYFTGLRTDCPHGRYDNGGGKCVPYPSAFKCPEGTYPTEDGVCLFQAN
jgi:hypothetical protein